MSGKQIKLFLVDGTPGGLSTAEITNWTGHVLTAPRSQLCMELPVRHGRLRRAVLELEPHDGDFFENRSHPHAELVDLQEPVLR